MFAHRRDGQDSHPQKNWSPNGRCLENDHFAHLNSTSSHTKAARSMDWSFRSLSQHILGPNDHHLHLHSGMLYNLDPFKFAVSMGNPPVSYS